MIWLKFDAIMKTMCPTGYHNGERLWLVRGVVGGVGGDSEKISIWGCHLIEFGEFSPQKRNLHSFLRK